MPAAAIAVSLGAWAHGQEGRGRDEPKHLTAAQEIAAEIRSGDNEYAHKECFITWKGADGAAKYVNRTDCSDFFNLLLEHVYGFTKRQFKTWTGHERPAAAAWYDAAAGGKAEDLLQPVKTLDEALPGDVILVKYPPGEPDTGHVMLVASTPRERDATEPVERGTRQWEVDVIDSSKSGHGPSDTRRKPDGTFGSGVGRGVLRLYTNPDGTIAGYAWSTLKVSKFEPQSRHALLVVRLKSQNGVK